MPYYPEEIEHGPKYYDDCYEYKSVYLSKVIYAKLPKNTLLTETQCDEFGIRQSTGWKHYLIFANEPNVLHFRRPLGTNPTTGKASDEILMKIEQLEKKIEEEIKEYELYMKSNYEYENEELKPFQFSKK